MRSMVEGRRRRQTNARPALRLILTGLRRPSTAVPAVPLPLRGRNEASSGLTFP